jgi:hypothetical protein
MSNNSSKLAWSMTRGVAMNSPRVIYAPRPDATPEAEVDMLANVYRFILDCHAKKEAAEPDSSNNAAIVRNTEEVSHVEQRPDRPSETTYPATLESAHPRTHKTRRHKQSPRKGPINGRDKEN